MVYHATVVPNKHAAKVLSIDIVEHRTERTDAHGDTIIYWLVVPGVSVHPLWKIHGVRYRFDWLRNGEWTYGIEGGQAIDKLDATSMLDASVYDYEYDSVTAGHTIRKLTYLELEFVHTSTGKIIVTETFPKKLIVYEGSLMIDR